MAIIIDNLSDYARLASFVSEQVQLLSATYTAQLVRVCNHVQYSTGTRLLLIKARVDCDPAR